MKRVHIGDVLIVPSRRENPYKGGSAIGPERKVALMAFRDGWLKCSLAAWYGPAGGGARKIGPDEVDWESSGLPVGREAELWRLAEIMGQLRSHTRTVGLQRDPRQGWALVGVGSEGVQWIPRTRDCATSEMALAVARALHREAYAARCALPADCPVCERYTCSRCQRVRPWTDGAHDETPALCDDCAAVVKKDWQ